MKPNLNIQGCCNAYVLQGKDPKERSKRLRQVPESLRASVKIHVMTALSIKANHENINRYKKQRGLK